jgi:hypothetical protein
MKLLAQRVRNYKWIERRIDHLDPGVAYEEIWRLAHAYRISEFQMNFFYAYIFAHFIVTPQAARTVVRGGTGKVLHRQDKRFSDTNRNTLTWWENGPSAAETQRSVASLNKLHAHYAKQFPGDFSHNDDYLYGLCLEAAAFHRFRLQVGLPGYTAKLQVAAHRFWGNMVPLFTAEGGVEVTGWPADFPGILEFLTEYESRPQPHTDESIVACEAIIGQFAERYFPGPLRGLARTTVIAMYPEHILNTLRLKPPHAFSRRAVRTMFKAAILLSERVMPDPRESVSERLTASGSPSAGLLGAAACPHAPASGAH